MGKIGELNKIVADLTGQRPRLLVRPLQEFVEEPELMHYFERRGVDRIAAEVAQKIGVLLQNRYRNAGSGQ